MPEHSDEHIIEAIGRCRVVIRDGKVVSVAPPVIRRCPLAERFERPVTEITEEAVRANIEHRIARFGMCTPDREVYAEKEFVGFGASELIGGGMKAGLIDAAVIACDGAGTVIAATPGLVQGIGGRMSGLVKTSPIPGVMNRIQASGGHVLDRLTAEMDPVAGIRMAKRLGYTKIAVTVASAEDAVSCRGEADDALIIVVHTTGMTPGDSDVLAHTADLITCCASGSLRRIAGRKALAQAGTAIPVFAMTPKGKRLIFEKLMLTNEPVLVKGMKLPFAGDREPEPLV
ncbi:MAG: DUF2099 family protein [Methanoregulaceae archaeon]|nr:DUF2099 family protein [Methanoregulaceae archaeon]